ncbi:hypothetical protein KM043_016233 [Ampulex compressa]|nr:hypothetical protein KM043_016233 [Ampulex compressa]
MDKAIKPFDWLYTVKRSAANTPADDTAVQTEDDNAIWIIHDARAKPPRAYAGAPEMSVNTTRQSHGPRLLKFRGEGRAKSQTPFSCAVATTEGRP